MKLLIPRPETVRRQRFEMQSEHRRFRLSWRVQLMRRLWKVTKQ